MNTKTIVSAIALFFVVGSAPSFAEPSAFAKQLSAAYGAIEGFEEKSARAARGLIDSPETISDRRITTVSANWQDKSFLQGLPHQQGKVINRHPSVSYEREGTLVPAESFPQLQEARRMLISALARGARHSYSGKTAAAQAQFECWAKAQSPTCQAEATLLIGNIFQATEKSAYFRQAAQGNIDTISCHTDLRERRYSFDPKTELTDSVAEILDRAHIEFDSGIACLETLR
ncbi:MAG: hypothetical protein OQJ97_13705 [Rhodospirillales bacterium]|nr:hypothetical protein [Rhodospirillales bacterium]